MSSLKTIVSETHVILPHDGTPATRVEYEDPLPGGRTYKSVALYVDDCLYCQEEKERGSTFFPSHFANSTCQSGKRNHCTCDGCF